MAINPKDDSDNRRSAADLSARADLFKERQLEVSAGVYDASSYQVPDLVGSCVLIRLGDARFLVTAGHVLDHRHSAQLTIGVSPEFVGLSGDATRLDATPSSAALGDHVDLGIVRLAGEPWRQLPEAHFASWNEIDIRPPLAENHSFGLVGFPCSKNRKSVRGDRMISKAYGVVGMECSDAEYRDAGYDPTLNLMIDFVKEDVWGADGQRNAPDLYGVSGCGLWRYGRQLRHDISPPLLSGIAIEWHPRGRNKFILGTRIHVVIAALAAQYADVAAFVKRSVS